MLWLGRGVGHVCSVDVRDAPAGLQSSHAKQNLGREKEASSLLTSSSAVCVPGPVLGLCYDRWQTNKAMTGMVMPCCSAFDMD